MMSIQKNIFFYLVAFALLLVSFFFFKIADEELINDTTLTNKSNQVLYSLQKISGQINSAVALKAANATNQDEPATRRLFIADSHTVVGELRNLKYNISDPAAGEMVKKIEGRIQNELSWLFVAKSSSEAAMPITKAQVARILLIDSLIKKLSERTNVLSLKRSSDLNYMMVRERVWRMLFVVLSIFLLLYTTFRFLRQQEKRIRKDKELEIANRLLTNAQHIARIGNWKLSMDKQLLEWSDEIYRIWHVTKESFTTSYANFLASVHPEDRILFEQEITASISGKSELDFEHRIVTPNGSLKWIHQRGQLVIDRPGKPFFFSGTAQDITKRKTLELTRQEAIDKQFLFASIVNSSEDAILSKTLEGIITSWNQGAEMIFGYTAAEAIGQDASIIIPEELLQEEPALLNKIKHGQRVQHFETMRVRKDGVKINVSLTVSSLRDSQGTITGASHIAQNITERKKSEEKIYEANQRFEYVTMATFDAIWDWDIAAKTVFWGERYFHLFGRMEDNGLTDLEKVMQRIHPSDTRMLLDSSYRSLKSPDATWSEEHRFLKSDGTYALVSNKAVIIRDAGGRATRVIGAMQDITKRKEEERLLRLMESVITCTTDGVLVMEVQGAREEAPVIVYVNAAFSRLTGYEPAEMLGRTPIFLEGPETDPDTISRLQRSLLKGVATDITAINYKKNGEAFWLSSSFSPATDKNGNCTHWIAIQRDVTAKKNEELQTTRLAAIMKLFNDPVALDQTLQTLLEHLLSFNNFILLEAWLIRSDNKRINLVARAIQHSLSDIHFYEGAKPTSFSISEGLPGKTWKSQAPECWSNISENLQYGPQEMASRLHIDTLYGIPVSNNGEMTGVLIIGLEEGQTLDEHASFFLEHLARLIAPEIRRKQLEQELNQIFSFAPDIICSIGLDGFLKKTNPAASELLEYSQEELLASPFSDFIHPADQEQTARLIAMMGRGKSPFYMESRFITKTGRVKWLASNCAPSPSEGLIFSVAKDITEKKVLETLLDKTSNMARIGSWEADLINGSIYWSDIIKEIHEESPAYLPDLQKTISFYKEGKSRDLITQKIRAAIEKGTPWDLELQIVTHRGTEKWVRSIGEPEFINGTCVKIYGSIQDIDARKRAEIAETRALEEKNTILESISDGFFAVDKIWTITYVNKQAEKVWRRQKTELLNRNIWEVFTNSRNTVSYKKYHEAVALNQVIHFEDFYPAADSWYEVSAYPSDNGLSVYFRDITERKLSELTLNQLNESLEKRARELADSNAELEQFAYIASHDLQEPLRNISSFLTLLSKQYEAVLDEMGKKYIDFAVDGAQRMRQIILDLLEYSRVGRTDELLEMLNLNNLVRDIQVSLAQNIEETGARITCDPLPVIHSVKTPMRQVFQNLLGNALKYAGKDLIPEIHIGCLDLGHEWQFFIRDNGIGIHPKHYHRIFIIFQRLHNRTAYPGTGMGLAITKKIIENLGGRIWLESEEGKGSTFYFTIPKEKIG